MYARQTTFQGDVSKAEELLKTFREQGLPTLRQQRGSKGARLLLNRNTGKAIVVTLWESAEAAEAAEASVREQRARGAQTFGASSPSTELFEILVMEDF